MIKRLILSLLLVCVGLVNLWADAVTVQVTITQHKYATFSYTDPNVYSIQIPDDVTAYKMSAVVVPPTAGEYAFTLRLQEMPLDAERKITGENISSMILYSETAGDYTINVQTTSNNTATRSAVQPQSFGRYSFDNMLIPTVEGMTCDEIMANMEIADEVIDFENTIQGEQPATRTGNDAGYYYYKLAAVTHDVNTRVGFFWGAEDGGSFKLGGHKSVLAISRSTLNSAKVRFVDETGLFSTDEATGIALIPVDDAPEIEIVEGCTYDLLGRKVTTTIPGHIYIKNGKKYIR